MSKEAMQQVLEALRLLIDHTHDCEKELTEKLHGVDFCGESSPLTTARRILALAEQPAQQKPVAGGKLQVTLQDTPTEIELAQYKRMFSAACADLAEINEALGLDPNDGGAEPILFVIKELKGRSQEPVAWMYVNTDGECEQIEYGEPFDGPDVTPLYTSPQPCPTCEALARSVMLDQTSHDALRKPLTDDEIWEIAERCEDYRFSFARAIEAAHGIKEKNT